MRDVEESAADTLNTDTVSIRTTNEESRLDFDLLNVVPVWDRLMTPTAFFKP